MSVTGCAFDVTFFDVQQSLKSRCVTNVGGEVCEADLNVVDEGIWNIRLRTDEHLQLNIADGLFVLALTDAENEDFSEWEYTQEQTIRSTRCEDVTQETILLRLNTAQDAFTGERTFRHVVTDIGDAPEPSCDRPEREEIESWTLEGVLAEGF